MSMLKLWPNSFIRRGKLCLSAWDSLPSLNANVVLSVYSETITGEIENPSKQMSRERLKWTTEEEVALFAGVEKHGIGKWKVILTDPQFASILKNRSNIDLKDKWRNVNVNRDRVQTPTLEIVTTKTMSEEVTNKAIPPLELDSPIPLSVVHLIKDSGTKKTPISEEVTTKTKTLSRTTIDRRIAPDYEAMILEALFYKEGNEADIDAILDFIQERYELPKNFERSVTSMLRRLVLTGELEKEDNLFKIYKGESETPVQKDAEIPLQNDVETPIQKDAEIPVPKDAETPVQKDVGPFKDNKNDEKKEAKDKCNSPLDTETTCKDNKQDEEKEETHTSDSPIATETIEDATWYAVNVVSRAENRLQEAIEACKEADRFGKLVEESTAMLKLAEEVHEMCKEDGIVLLRP